MVSFKGLRSKKTDDPADDSSAKSSLEKGRNAKRWNDGYSLPAVFSVLIHCLAVGIALVVWSPPAELRITPVPQYMAAKLVEIQEEKPKPVPKPAPKPEPKPVKPEKKTPVKETRPKVDEKALQLKKEKEAKAKAEKEKKEREAKEKRKREEEQRKKEELRKKEEQRKKEEARKKQERELAERLQREKAAKEAQAKAEAEAREVASKVQYFTGFFIHDLSYNWSRPPSARNNMRAKFRITLSRFGDILTVSLLKGSGDPAFDRSAEQAIRKAAPFRWVQQMDSPTFNRFKQFSFEFNPEDLVK